KGIIIRTPIDQISITKRATQGVKIINLVEDHAVSTIALVAKEEDDNLEILQDNEIITSDDMNLETPKTDSLEDNQEEEKDEVKEILENTY
ncbi:MAG: DNA gyrase C-terminal beta-propeller domain-containing protein, partial [Candidatus Izemoplasmatales bacterium]